MTAVLVNYQLKQYDGCSRPSEIRNKSWKKASVPRVIQHAVKLHTPRLVIRPKGQLGEEHNKDECGGGTEEQRDQEPVESAAILPLSEPGIDQGNGSPAGKECLTLLDPHCSRPPLVARSSSVDPTLRCCGWMLQSVSAESRPGRTACWIRYHHG